MYYFFNTFFNLDLDIDLGLDLQKCVKLITYYMYYF